MTDIFPIVKLSLDVVYKEGLLIDIQFVFKYLPITLIASSK